MARWFLSASVNRMRRARGGAPPLAWRERSLQPAVSPSHAIHTNCRPDLVQRLLVSSCALQGLLIIRYAQDDYVALAFLIKVFQVLLLLRDESRLSTRALSYSQFLLATLFWAVIVSLRASIALTTSSILLMMLASVVPSSPDASMMSINSSLFFLVSWLRCNVFPSPVFAGCVSS